jgi:hypothetical protein
MKGCLIPLYFVAYQTFVAFLFCSEHRYPGSTPSATSTDGTEQVIELKQLFIFMVLAGPEKHYTDSGLSQVFGRKSAAAMPAL